MGERLLDWMLDNVVPWLMSATIGFIVLVIVALPFALYAESQAETFELKKYAWVCSQSVERPTTTYIQTGNIMVPMTTYSKHCTQWSEKP